MGRIFDRPYARCNGRETSARSSANETTRIDFYLDQFDGLRVTFDEEGARKCIERDVELEAHCNLYWLSFNEEPEACRVFVGQQNAGAPCSASVECALDNVCREGVCAAPDVDPRVHVQLGGACGQTCQGDHCDSDDYLAGTVPPPADSPACFREDGLFCSGGTCQPLSGLGGRCAVRADCDGFYRCDEASYTCAPFAQEGERCYSNYDCESYRCDGDVDASVCSPIVAGSEDDCIGDQ